jgi:ATP-dependent helicase/nuclease subunit B
VRMERPAPKPPVEARPRSLSVTEIETWMRDPYAIYAKHVLRLRPLDPLDAEIGALERGTAVHLALERFLAKYGEAWPLDADAALIDIGREIFQDIPKSTLAVWQPRFEQAARWFVKLEQSRRPRVSRSHLEQPGRRVFQVGPREFALRCRADRIDALRAGGASIIDYKTGKAPTKKQVELLWAPQLPLEGVILREGGFEHIGALEPAELLYIKFSGGAQPGDEIDVSDNIGALVEKAEEILLQMIAHYDQESATYIPRVRPYRADISGDYDHLSRVREWSLSGWERDDDE